jgi:GntR family transcriptional regulator
MAARDGLSVGHKLAAVLRERIARGDYAKRVPTESELMIELGMSRYAVRSAMLRLERDGVIERRPGRGTTVVERSVSDSAWAIRTVEDLIDRNLLERPKILSAKPARAAIYPDYAALFGLGPKARLFVIERLSRGEVRQRAFYSINAMPLDVGLALTRRNIGREPLIVQIERARKVRAYRVRQDIRGSQASTDVARYLGVDAGHPTVIVRRTYYGWDGEAIAIADLHYRLDLFRQSIDLFRENAPN